MTQTQTPQPQHAPDHHWHDPDSHGHGHTHQRPMGNHADYESANKDFFDAAAQQYDQRRGERLRAEKIGRAMRDTGLFKQGVTTVMDFACGTGLISRELAAEDPKSILGVDISRGMVDQYNKVVNDHGITPEEMKAVCANLLEGGPDELDGMKFDVIVCACAYHHLSSIDRVTQTLVTYLNPGGSLLVSDIAHGESVHKFFPKNVDHICPHQEGFTEEGMRSTFESAGLKDFTFHIIARTEDQVELFLARGDKQ